MISQSITFRDTTPKKPPPKVTIAICPIKMAPAIRRKPPHPLKWKAERADSNERVLNIFQNWKKTKVVKKIESS